jgi:hypothetical protein
LQLRAAEEEAQEAPLRCPLHDAPLSPLLALQSMKDHFCWTFEGCKGGPGGHGWCAKHSHFQHEISSKKQGQYFFICHYLQHFYMQVFSMFLDLFNNVFIYSHYRCSKE